MNEGRIMSWLPPATICNNGRALRHNRTRPWLRCRGVLIGVVAALFAALAPGGSEAQDVGGRGPRWFSPEELEDLVAPIALYPDSLVAQILPASVYPLDVVEASRWAAKHNGLAPAALGDALEQQDWDPSVKALVYFPRVLKMLDENLDWTRDLGEAFVNQEQDVMDAVQRMRAKAMAAGSLQSSPKQRIIVEDRIIRILPSDPQVVYVPVYDPQTVFISRPYYSPADMAAAEFISFSAGILVGTYWHDYDCDWHHGYVWHRPPHRHSGWKPDHDDHHDGDRGEGGHWRPDPDRRRDRGGSHDGESRQPGLHRPWAGAERPGRAPHEKPRPVGFRAPETSRTPDHGGQGGQPNGRNPERVTPPVGGHVWGANQQPNRGPRGGDDEQANRQRNQGRRPHGPRLDEDTRPPAKIQDPERPRREPRTPGRDREENQAILTDRPRQPRRPAEESQRPRIDLSDRERRNDRPREDSRPRRGERQDGQVPERVNDVKPQRQERQERQETRRIERTNAPSPRSDDRPRRSDDGVGGGHRKRRG